MDERAERRRHGDGGCRQRALMHSLVRIGQYIIDTKCATSQTSLPVSFTEVLVSFKRCALLRYLHRLILASEPCHLPACWNRHDRHSLATWSTMVSWLSMSMLISRLNTAGDGSMRTESSGSLVVDSLAICCHESRATPVVSCRCSFSVCCFSSRHQYIQWR